MSVLHAAPQTDNSDAWLALVGESIARTNHSQFSEAERSAFKAIRLAKGADAADFRAPMAYRALGYVYQQWSRCPASVAAYRKALELCDAAGWRNEPLALDVTTALIDQLCTCGEARAADRLLTARIAQLRQAAARQGVPHRAFLSQAHVAFTRHHYAQAEAYLREARNILMAQSKPSSLALALVDSDLDSVVMHAGRAGDALEHGQHAVAEFESAGGNVPEYAYALNNLACSYAVVERVEESLSTFRRAIEVSRQTSGDFSPQIARILANYAGALRIAHRASDAAEADRQVHDIYSRNALLGNQTADVELLRLLKK